MVFMTSDPRRRAPENSKMAAITIACLMVKDLAPTEVAKAVCDGDKLVFVDCASIRRFGKTFRKRHLSKRFLRTVRDVVRSDTEGGKERGKGCKYHNPNILFGPDITVNFVSLFVCVFVSKRSFLANTLFNKYK